MQEKISVPAIRFAGFTNTWEQRKASNLFSDVADKGHPELPVLSATQDKGMVIRDDIGKSVFHDITNEAGYKRVVPGQFVIHLRSFQGGFAHSAVEGITSPAYTVFGFQDPEKHDEYFWKFVFSSKEFVKRLESVTYGIRDGRSISYSEFLTMSFGFPSSDEQRRISTFLLELDHLITLHQRKYSRLCNIKKSMLERMFPRDRATVPEIRFAGFTDAWEQRKLGDITQEVSDYATLTSDLPLLTSSRTGLMYQNEYRDNLATDSKDTLFSVVPFGACTYRHMSDDDVFHLNVNCLEKGLVSREYPVFFATEGNDLSFIVQHVNSSGAFRSFCKEQKKGGTRTRLYYDVLCEFSMSIPSFQEQQKISGFLAQLDHLITLHQRQLERLQNIKKACLEKMFV